MTETEVVELMESSTTEQEWNANCDKVKKQWNGYPPFWFSAIVLSGLMRRVSAKFGGTDEIRVSAR